MKNRTVSRVIIFYAVALVVSNIFRFDLFNLQPYYDTLPLWKMLIYSPLQSFGVLLGALIAFRLLRKKRETEISLWGTSKKWSLIMVVIPVVLLLVLGVDNSKDINVQYYGFFAGLSTLIYCIFEEYGWRGYLEEELKDVSELKRVLLIAGLWYLWHLSFISDPDIVQNLFFIGCLILGSWGLGKIVQTTKSILAASCFHLLINVLLFNGFVKDGLDGTDQIIILAVLIPVWVLILRLWKKEQGSAVV